MQHFSCFVHLTAMHREGFSRTKQTCAIFNLFNVDNTKRNSMEGGFIPKTLA